MLFGNEFLDTRSQVWVINKRAKYGFLFIQIAN